MEKTHQWTTVATAAAGAASGCVTETGERQASAPNVTEQGRDSRAGRDSRHATQPKVIAEGHEEAREGDQRHREAHPITEDELQQS